MVSKLYLKPVLVKYSLKNNLIIHFSDEDFIDL